MENKIDKLNPEPYKPYPISDSVKQEIEDFLKKVADPKLEFEEWKKLKEKMEKKSKDNPEYRLAYLRQSTSNPDMYVSAEIHELERQLREKH